MQTFANLPEKINQAISETLSDQQSPEWLKRVEILHESYMSREKKENYINDYADTIAYLALRTPATYAQIHGAIEQVQTLLPDLKPESVLDIGSGPGTGIWAAKSVWPTLETATCIDKNEHLLITGEEIIQKADIFKSTTWKKWDSVKDEELNLPMHDVVIVANVLNELSVSEARFLIGQAYNRCRSLMIIVEPGTPFGIDIIESAAKSFSNKNLLIAPYIDNNFIANGTNWLHFSQRFVRPEFQKRIRQKMRADSLTASDWEEAKYAYVAISKIDPKLAIWGRVVGHAEKQKGFIEVPVLTSKGIEKIKVLKRNKENYNFAKELKWGDIISGKSQLTGGIE